MVTKEVFAPYTTQDSQTALGCPTSDMNDLVILISLYFQSTSLFPKLSLRK